MRLDPSDPRLIKKEKYIGAIRQRLLEIERFKKSPEGQREFILRWIDEKFGKSKGRKKDEQSKKN